MQLIEYTGEIQKILIVDDQAVNIRLLQDIFRDECSVFMARNGEQAIAQCRALLPDLVLLDLIMPGMDGFAVCQHLKADPLTRDIPVIFLSAQREEADEIRGFELGIVDYIVKPFNRTVLCARVRTHLALKLQTDLLRRIAMVDGLTGIANRRKFDEQLQASWMQCTRDQQPLSVLMLDVDYFKKYNDHYGHQMGDECLKSVAQCVEDTLRRPFDVVCRYGGEEFACVLPNTDPLGALHLAEQVLRRVGELKIEHAQSDVAPYVTVSVGVATVVPDPKATAASLLERADRQLYAAKQAGRGRASANNG